MKDIKINLRGNHFKQVVAILLIITLTFGSLDISGFFGVSRYYFANETENVLLQTSNSLPATNSNASLDSSAYEGDLLGEEEDDELLNDGAIENDIMVDGMLRSRGLYARPDASQLQTVDNFLVQSTEDGIIIWGFADGYSTEDLVIPPTLSIGGNENNVIEIGADAFAQTGLKTLVIGENVKKIGENAFSANELETLLLPDNIEVVEKDAFRDNKFADLNLNKVKSVGDTAFANNLLTNLNLGEAIEEIGLDSFRNNDLTEVNFPSTLTTVGAGSFTYNNRYVKVTTDLSPLPSGVPAKDTVSGGFGYVIDPINITIIHRDAVSGERIASDIMLSSDLTSTDDIYVLNMPQTYIPPEIVNYSPVSNPVTFTPDVDNYILQVDYNKSVTTIHLVKNNDVAPLIGPFSASTTDDEIRTALLSLVKATGENDVDLSEDVVFGDPNIYATIRNAAQSSSVPVEYILRNNLGEEKRLRLDVLMGTDMLQFPLRDGWVLGDFVYGGDTGTGVGSGLSNSVLGFSPQGMAKVNAGKVNVVLPHINPRTNTPITKIGNGSTLNLSPSVGTSFQKVSTIKSITDFDENIELIHAYAFYGSKLSSVKLNSVKEIQSSAFQSNSLSVAEFPSLLKIGSNAFYSNGTLEEFDFSSVEYIGPYSFHHTSLKKAIAPNVTDVESSAFANAKIGSDPDYEQGFYFPKLTKINNSVFNSNYLKYIDRNKQMPMATIISSSAFQGNDIVTADLTGITEVQNSAFYGQRRRVLNNLIAPNLEKVGISAFLYNGLTSLDLPTVKTLEGSSFKDNYITEINAPMLETLNGGYNFSNNQLSKVQLPSLRKASGSQDFANNLIKEAYLDNIQPDGLGKEIFYTSYFPNLMNSPHAKNPGLTIYGNYIPVYTNTPNVSSRENYIINPIPPTGDAYEEDDFTWDVNDPSIVTGLTSKGKTKLLSKNHHLVLPDRAKIVGERAFHFSGVKSVTSNEVVEIRDYGFSQNPLSRVNMPKLSTIKNGVFQDNKGFILSGFDFTNITSIGNYAFSSSGLNGALDLPQIREISVAALHNNRITSVNAPMLEIVKQNGLSSNQLSSIDSVQFPALRRIEGNAFQSNPVVRIDLPDLLFSTGNNEFAFSNTNETVVWEQNPNIQSASSNKSVYSAYTFNSYTPAGQSGRYQRPGGIILTSPRNPDGSLNRTNPNRFTEMVVNGSGYTNANGRYTYPKVRKAVIDPGTVTVNYVIEGTNEGFYGTNGKPNVPNYTEMIYEELEPRDDATGALATTRKYSAPSIPGYVLVSSTDAGGSVVPLRRDLQVPFEPLGQRTDRSVTFTYRKLETNLNPSIKLDYFIHQSSSSPYELERTYTGSNLNNQQISTEFSLNKIGSNFVSLNNAKLIIETDSPYIDLSRTIVANDSTTASLYDPSGVVKTTNGVEISLKNTGNLSAINNVGVNFFTLGNYAVPDITHAHFNIRLVSQENGVEKIIAEGKPLTAIFDLTNIPNLTVAATPLVNGYPYTNTNASENGPRNMGEIETVNGVNKAISDPSPVTFDYHLNNTLYPIDEITITHVLPTYTAYNPTTGQEELRTAVFNPILNPSWQLSEDGKSVISKNTPRNPLGGNYSTNYSGKFGLPKLYLKFPDIIEGANTKSDVFVSIVKGDDPINPVTEQIENARGDLGIGDSITIYPLQPRVIVPDGQDFSFDKTDGSTPNFINNRAVMYDNETDRPKEFHYSLTMTSTNETTDMTNVNVIDYGLDSRLRYKRVQFIQNPSDVKYSNARVRAYRKVSSNIDPQNDIEIISRTVAINTSTSVVLPNEAIDYVKVDIPETETAPLNFTLRFNMVVELKEPSQKLLNNVDPNFFINKAIFSATAKKKGTDIPAMEKPTDPDLSGIDGNLIFKDEAKVGIIDYRFAVRAEKLLKDNSNPSGIDIFPPYSSGDAIVGGQEGHYFIRLNASQIGNPSGKVNSVLNNFELIDIFPEGMSLTREQIVLTNEFQRSGGEFEILANYPTIENGVSLNKRAIRFKAQNLDLSKFSSNHINIATIKTKFVGDTAKTKLTNSIYATWTPKEDTEIHSVARNAQGENIGPNGQTSINPWSESSVSVQAKVASSLIGNLEIRNHKDHLWTTSIKTGSEEPFDYRMTVGQMDTEATSTTYQGIELLNIFPGVNDVQLSKSAERNSKFSNTFDTSRMSDLKVYITRVNGSTVALPASNYTIKYINTDNGVDTLLLGRTVDQLSDTPSFWSDAPSSNTKALKVKLSQGIILSYGDKLNIEIPMKAPALNGVNDPLIDKAAIDSFSLRYNKNGNPNPEEYREVNNVNNIMEGKKGGITFQKLAKVGLTTPDSQATPLAGAVFLLTDTDTNKTQTAVSRSDGWVTFENLDIRHQISIEEIYAPDGYSVSTNKWSFNLSRELTDANNYNLNVTQRYNRKWVNVKNITGSIKIIKKSIDPNITIPNILFRIQGQTNSSEYSNTHVNMTVSTGTDGTVTIPNIPEGRYQVTELINPETLRFTDMESKYIQIQNNNADITLEYTNAVMQLPLRKIITSDPNDLDPANWDKLTDFQRVRVGGYRFKIVGANGQIISPTTSTSTNPQLQGEVIVSGLRPNIVYTVTEELNQTTQNAKLYEHNPTEYRFMLTPTGKLINPDNQRVFRQNAINFPNLTKKVKGKIVVNKTDDATTPNPVAGAKFEIYKISYASDGSIASSTKIGATKTSVLNGAKAEVVFDDLEPATYQVREIEAAPGYYLGNTATNFIITVPSSASLANLTNNSYNFDGNNIIFTHNQTVSNKKSSVKAIKGEDLTGKTGISIAEAQNYVSYNPQYRYRVVGNNVANVYSPLGGVVFELYKSQNGAKQGSAININGNTDIVSNANGELDFGNFAFDENQEYSIYEKTPLAGYERLNNPKTFKLANEARKSDFNGTLNLHINNRKLLGSILVSKYDSITRRPIYGAKFRLYRGHDAIAFDSSGHIAEVISGLDGFAYFGNLEIGQYTVREVTAPDGYMPPSDAIRDRKLTVSAARLNPSYVAYNTRARNIRISKTWGGGSEASVQLKLLRKTAAETTYTPVVAPVIFGTEPNTAAGNTATDGTITLNASTGLNVVFPNMPLASESGREYSYQVQEVSVTKADGTVVPVVNNLIGNAANPDYSVLIGGNINNGFTVQNIAYDRNKRSVMVNKSWTFADGSTTPPPGTKIVIALMKKIGNEPEVEARRKTLDISNHWTHTFTDLEKRNAGREVTYSVKEISSFDGLISTVTEDVSQQTVNSNVFKISNTAIKRSKVIFKKNWVGINPSNAPSVMLELYDSENMTTPMFTKPITRQVDGSYQAEFTDVPSFVYTVEPNTMLAENDPNKGKLVARKIKYVVKEKFTDGQPAAGYTTTSNLTDAAFLIYSSNSQIANDLNFTITNTMENVNFKLKKNWVGIHPSDAPNVQVRLLDVTADTTADQSDSASHIILDTYTLSYNANADLNFTETINNLPKYKPDGRTLVKYKFVEMTNLNGYTSIVSPIVEVDANNRTVNITNTRVTKSLRVKKQWNMAVENFLGANQNTPEVTFDIFADTTNDNVVNPTPYTQSGVQTTNLKLNRANSYELAISNLYQYNNDGSFEIKYYAKEHAVSGYTLPVEAGTGSLESRTGRILLSESANGELEGTFINKQELINLNVVVLWQDLNMYTPSERQNLPVPNIDVYDYTDPNNPKLVRENVPMVLVEDPSTPNRARWTASMPNLPKYTSDGQKAIIYEARQRQSYSGYTTTQITDPFNASGNKVNIRDNAGNVLTDSNTLLTNIANANVWNAQIVNKPKKRDIVVKKIWEGPVGASATVYLLKNAQRTAPVAGGTTITPVVITQNTAGQTEEWSYTFKDMPYMSIDGNTVNVYGIEELDIVNYHKKIELSEVAVPNSDIANVQALVTNSYKTIDITVKKEWVDVNPQDAPEVHLQLMDITDASSPVAVSNQIAVLNNTNSFTTVLENMPKYADDGTTLKKYSVVETPSLAGYRFETNTSYSDTPSSTSPDGTAVITAKNTRLTQEFKVEKIWVGVDPQNAPNVVIELFDVTDDTTSDLSNVNSHISLGTKTLTYSANADANFKTSFTNLSKYRADGVREVKYKLVEKTALPEYNTVVSTITTVSPTVKSASITNTYKTVDITVKKTWEGILPANAPEVRLQLVDATDPANKTTIANKVATLNNNNGFQTVLEDLPKFKPDGTTRIRYEVMETPDLPGYDFRVATTNSDVATANSPDGTVEIISTNKVVTQEVKVTKTWSGVEQNLAPQIVVELFDITSDSSADHSQIATHQSLGTKTLSYNADPARSFTDTYTNLPKYKADGTTEIKYLLKERTNLAGYTTEVGEVTNESALMKSVQVTNQRNVKNIRFTKSFAMLPEIYTGSTLPTPDIVIDILADKTNDNVVNPTPYTQVGKTTTGIVLNQANRYTMEMDGLNQYAEDGVTEITYYIKERSVQGYMLPSDPTATTVTEGLGRAVLSPNASGVLVADLRNTQEKIRLTAEVIWHDLDIYPQSERNNLPVPTIDIWDKTDPGNPKKVRENVLLTLTEVPGSNNERWTASMDDLPKYTADGKTAIIYQIDQVENFDGYTSTELTEPKNSTNAVINIRNNDGSIHPDRNITTSALSDVTVWEGVIHNTPKTRDVKVKKIWAGPAKNDVRVYLTRDNVRINPDPIQTVVTPTVITQTMAGQTENWSYTFKKLPYTSINGTSVYNYNVEEVVPSGYAESIARTEENVANGVPNIKFEITNSFKTIDITLKKTWEGVDLAEAPQVVLQLMDITNAASPVEVTGKTVTLNSTNNFTQELTNLPKYKSDGVTEIQYSAKEVPTLAGYTFSVNTTYDNTATTQSPYGSAQIIAKNTRVLQEVKVDKQWVGVDASTTPIVEVELFDVTDDASAGFGNTALHKSLGRRNLSYNGSDASVSYTTVYQNLPKYRPDGTTEVVYMMKENTALPEFSTNVSAVNTIDASRKQASITNTFKTVDVHVVKTWTNIAPANAPNITLQLMDATESTKVPVAGKVALLNATNLFRFTFEDLPKFKADGVTPIVYEVAETPARPGYRFTQTSIVNNTPTVTSPFGSITINANNELISQEIAVTKVWEGIDPSQAPNIEVELLDVTADTTVDYSNTTSHISKGRKTLSFNAVNPAASFKDVYTNLPKYQANGQTLVKYLVKEITALDGYTATVGAMTENDSTHYSVEIRNQRKQRNLNIQKNFTMADEIYPGFNSDKPSITIDILADVTPNGVVDPTPYTQTGITTQNIVLDSDNSYRQTLIGLHQYLADGRTEVKYYAKERAVQGYTLPSDNTATTPVDGLGRVPLIANASGVLEGTLVNTQETIDLTAEVLWNDLNHYPDADRVNVPVPHLDVYDRTDPNTPKLVRANVPMVLSVDPTSNRARWTANMNDLPKYTADGSKAIIYSVAQRESYNGYRTTEITDPYNNTNLISIRDTNGDVITDTNTTTPALSDVTVWKTKITNTPITRDITVHKIWEGQVGGDVHIYLLRDNRRIDINPNATTVNPTTLSASNPTPWSHTFRNMPFTAIDGVTEYDYGVEEVVPAGYSRRIGKTEIPVGGTVSNLKFDITNSFKTVDIIVKKEWVGNTETTSPSVNLQLVDVTDSTNPITVVGKIAVLNTGNQFETILADLPKYKADGTTRIMYEVVETPARAGYTFAVASTFDDTPTQDSAEGTVKIVATNTRVKHNVKVVKNWVGVAPADAPSVEVELFDVTDDTSENHANTNTHISLGRKTLRYSANADENFTYVYTDIPKYRVDGTTEVVYMVKEHTNLGGYTTNISNVVNDSTNLKSVTITNTRKVRNIQINKTFAMADEIYANSNDNTPEVLVDIYADTTDNNIVDPTPYHQSGVVTQGIALNSGNSYQQTVSGLEQYMADGVTEIKYYAKERVLRGYILPTDPTAINPADGLGRVALTENLGVVSGTLHNVQEKVNLVTTLTWNGLEHYPTSDLVNLPIPNVDVWDITDPANPKAVRQNQPMTLTEVGGSQRVRWTANMNDLPKYTADGSTAIIYSVTQHQDYAGYTKTEVTNPTNANGLIDIRDQNGTILTDRNVTTQRLADVTTWRADITDTPKLRQVKVVKSWEGNTGNNASIYLKKNNVRIAENPNDAAIPYVLNPGNQWTKIFVNMPYTAIDGVTTNVYTIEEVPTANYQSSVTMQEENVPNQVSNLRFDVKNTFKTIDITVKKTWNGVAASDAPQIVLQLLDVTNPNVITELANQTVTLNSGNQFETVLQNLPKFKDDGVTPIRYSVKEVPELAGYTFTVHTNYSETVTPDSPFGTAIITANNDRIKQELKVTKLWDGIASNLAPSITVELFDVSDDSTNDWSNTASHISLGTKMLSYNADPSRNFIETFDNLNKYRADGITPIKYMIKEHTSLGGYKANIGAITDVDATHKSVEIRNERRKINLKVNKHWNMGIENYPSANADTPSVHFDILADTTNDNVVNPTAYVQTGIQTTGLVLDRSNHYELSINNLLQYTDDGLFEIKYYAKEADLQGYTEITDPSATNAADGNGRVALVADNGVLEGSLVNTRESIDLETTLVWNGLENFTPADRNNLPIPTLRVWDRTDPANPKLVRENIPMVLIEDMNSNRSRWTANMRNLPKYTPDGSTAIIYEVEQIPVYSGFTTVQNTNPYNGNTLINIRDASGNVLTHRPTTTASITPATVWRAEITNTPLLRDLTVVKTWAGETRNQISVYLQRNGQRISSDLSSDTANAVVISENTPNQSGSWTYTFEDLPYTLIDGMTVANYNVEEVKIPGFKHTLTMSEDPLTKNLHATLHNRFESVDVIVKKNYVGINPSFAPAVSLQLVDATDENNPIVLNGHIANLNNANDFTASFDNLRKFKDDGITRIKYSAIEVPALNGYEYSVQTFFDDTPNVNSLDGTVFVNATNTLITRKLVMKKIWEGDTNLTRPNVEYLLYADATDDNIENPIQLTDINGVPVDISLTASNRFTFEMDALKFAPNGVFEIKYYISEVRLPGYIPSISDKLLLRPRGTTNELYGEISNKIVPINVRVTNEWLNMDIFKDYDINDIPKLHITLYDSTDPSNPIPVSAEVLLTRDTDGLYKASFSNVPKYKPDGVTPIVYTTNPKEIEDGTLLGYVSTNSGPQIEANGDILIELTQTPRLRKITVQKKMKFGGNPPDVTTFVHLKLKHYFEESVPINNPNNSYTYESVPYFEIDGITERKYGLMTHTPDGYIMDIESEKTLQDPNDNRFTDLLFILILRRGRRRVGGGGGSVVRTNTDGNKTSQMPNVPNTTPDSPETPSISAEMIIGEFNGTNRVNTPSDFTQTGNGKLLVTDGRGKTIMIDQKNRNKYYVDKHGKIVPKTGDNTDVIPYSISFFGGITLLFVLMLRRKKEEEENRNNVQ